MGLLDFLFGAKPAVIADPEKLKSELFNAVAAQDDRRLKALCAQNLDSIRAHFKKWSKIPEGDRNNPERIQWYGMGLTTVLSCIQHTLGREDIIPELIDLSDKNPLIRIQNQLRKSSELAQQIRFDEAIEILNSLLIDTRSLKGAESELAKIYGLLGQCCFHKGSALQALPHLQQAIELCRKTGDSEGLRIYLLVLFEAHRYTGDSGAAANALTALSQFHKQESERSSDVAQVMADTRDSRRYANWKSVVLAGEPLNRVVVRIKDEVREVDEIKSFPESEKIQFEFCRNRPELLPATRLNDEGRQLGSAGKLDEAAGCFRSAAKADPFDPQSHYNLGNTLAMLEKYPQAVEAFAEAERLAPGWFLCRSDLWVAQQVSIGNLPHALLMAHRYAEDMPDAPAKKLKLLEDLAEKNVCDARLFLNIGLQHLEKNKMAAEKAFRKGLEFKGDLDSRTRLALQLALVLKTSDPEHAPCLEQAQENGGNLLAAATAKILLRS